jgi:hypothetical protein
MYEKVIYYWFNDGKVRVVMTIIENNNSGMAKPAVKG